MNNVSVAVEIKKPKVILDTNAVIRYNDAKSLLQFSEVAIITKTVIAELNWLVSKGRIKALPHIVATLEVVEDIVEIHTQINVRSKIKTLSRKLNVPGLLGDGRIGTNVLELKLPIITGDRDFANALEAMGAIVRRLK